MAAARRRQAVMLAEPRAVSLTTAWRAVGPLQVGSVAYGKVTGRVTSIAVDPADTTGNTVYVGTTGGGVWKSTNAAGAAASVQFAPLTDTLPVFSLDSGNSAIASLSIGALSVANGVVLAGTGDTNDALDSYYGSGLLRSADGGATWTLTQQSNDGANGVHSFVGLGFAGLAWSSASPNVVVAAVSEAVEGELVNAGDAEYSTRGLYYSTDAGVSWQMATIKDGSQIVQQPLANGQNLGGNAVTAVVWNPVRQRFYAAVRFHGYYESADGAVWTRLAAQPGAGLTKAACPANPGGTGSANCPIFRGALAVEPESGDTYAFTVDAGNGDQGIWRDLCAAVSGSCASGEIAFGVKLNAGPLETAGVVPQGDYNLTLAAMASGGNTLLFAGAIDLYRCSLTTASAGAGGCSFRNTTNVEDGCAAPAMVAPAQHALAVLAGSALPLLFVGSNGGLWRSLDGVAETGSPCSATDAEHFDNLNGGLGSLAEVVQFSQHPSDPNTLLVGLGANGTAATTAASGLVPWGQLSDGEGGSSAIDPVSPANWYVSTAAGVSITYCGEGSLCGAADFDTLPTIGAPQVSEDLSLIDPPWLLDLALSSNVVIGTCRVWRGPAADGSAWPGANVLSSEFGGPQNAVCDATNNYVRSLAAGGPGSTGATAAQSGSTVLYAGMAGVLDGGGTVGGHLFTTVAAATASSATAWTDLAGSPVTNDAASGGVFNVGGFDVSSIAVDPHDATGQTVYATVMGFSGNGISAAHVYRSIDGGAHWTNIASNLPDAPANSIVVDPNDANTVYIAMDTGVYVTDQVTSCAVTSSTTANCWSVYGTGLPNAPVVQLVASATLPVGDGTGGELRAATYGRGIWQIPLLTAVPITSAAITLTPTALTFATQAVGTASAAQTITVTNSGTAALVVSGVGVTGDFSETDNCVGAPVAVGASCAVQVVFSPTAAGAAAGVLTVSGNVPGGSATAALSGTGAAPGAVVLSPLGVSFGTVTVGMTSGAQTVTVENTGGVAATLGSESVSGDFEITANSCGSSLGAGGTCAVSVLFAPTAAGIRNGSLTVVDSTGTQATSLTGVGASVATDTISPTSLTFAAQMDGTESAFQTVFLTNSGDTALNGISVAIGAGQFIVVNGCGATLSGHAACSMQVTFAPAVQGTGAGTLTGSLVVTDQYGSQTVALAGTGVAIPTVALNPGSLTFPLTVVGQSSSFERIVVTNAGGGQLTIGAIAITGDFTEKDNCLNQSVAGPYSCNVDVTFVPTASGLRTGSVTITGTLPGQQATAALTGTAVAPAAIVLTPASLNFGTVELGATSGAQNVAVSNTGGQVAAMEPPVVSGDYVLTANTCGTSLAPGVGCTVSLVFAPTAAGTRSGTLNFADSAGDQAATLTGTGTSPPTDTLSTATLSFAAQQAGTTSAAESVTVTNSGDNCAGKVLSGAATCSAQVVFSPGAVGALAGTLTVTGTLAGQTATVALTGTGVTPAAIVLTPGSANFGAVTLGSASAAQNIAISNTGGVAASLTTIMVTGDFSAAAETCGLTLAPATGCTVSIIFKPTAEGARTGTMSVTDSVGTQTASLSGTGDSPPTDTLAPLSLTFGTQEAGTASAAQVLTLTNAGDAPLTLIAVQVSNANFAASIAPNNGASTGGCGPILAGRSSCTIAVTFTPTVAGVLTATLTVSDQLRSQTVALVGTGVAPPTVAVAPGSLSFASTAVGGSSAAQTVAITNSGDGSLTVGRIATSGDFAETDMCVGKVLTGGASCSVAVVFNPTVAGTRTGVLTVTGTGAGTTVAGQMATVTLTGTGAAPAAIVLDPTSASFGTVTLGASSMAQNVTISNTGGVGATLGGVSVSGDFALSANTCGSSLAASTGCTVGIVFTPTASGARTGVLTVTDSVGTQTAALTGTGASAATDGLAPLSLTFAPQQENTVSAAQMVTLTNNGDNALTLIAAQVTSGDFAATSACGSSLIGHASCAISVVSIPKSVGPETGVLTVSDQFRTQMVALSGTGVAPPGVTFSPLAGLTFGATGVTTTSAPQAMTLSNMGGEPLMVSAIPVTGDFAIPAATNTCTTVVAVGGACSFQVVFSPIVGGARVGTISAATNSPGPPLTLPLAGTGVDFSLNANGAASVTVASGQSAVFPLLLSSAAGIPGTAVMACTGAPANATCVVTPAGVPLGTATTISATVETGVTVAAALAHGERGWWVVVIPVLLPFAGWRRRRLAMMVVAGLLLAAGCGSGRTIPPPVGGGGGGTPPAVTPSGTYPIVVSATSAGLTRSVTLTLVVQ